MRLPDFLHKAPDFWRTRSNLSEILLPFSVPYYAFQELLRWKNPPKTLSVPVVCVGNITAGGAGKTPVALALGKALKAKGKNLAFISRGFGGKLPGPLLVNPAQHSALEVGDEPLLLARMAPCFVAKDRVAGAEAAIKAGHNLLILDDGMQHYRLQKTSTWLVIDGGYGIGNGLLIPAGPLRGKFANALEEASIIVLLGSDDTNLLPELQKAKKPILRATIAATTLSEIWLNKRVVAFAGMGRPEKFFQTLQAAGATLCRTIAYADHYPYKPHDLAYLHTEAKKNQATLVTTEKDWVRLSPELRKDIAVLPVELTWKSPEMLEKALAFF